MFWIDTPTIFGGLINLKSKTERYRAFRANFLRCTDTTKYQTVATSFFDCLRYDFRKIKYLSSQLEDFRADKRRLLHFAHSFL